jgi:hypothetical protein
VRVSQEYGLSQANWPKVEFDHLIPLCVGGANNIKNIWPEMLDHAHEKDRIEDQVCLAMSSGSMSQRQAIQEIFDWLRAHPLFELSLAAGELPQN